MPQFADSNGQTTTQKPKFVSGSGGGTFPKAIELLGELIMLTPIRVETVPGYEGKGTTERLTADTVVLTGDRAGEYPSMWWGQSPIVKAGEEVLRRGNGDIILGRLYRFPQSGNKAKFPTRQAIEDALANWRPGKPDVKFAWALETFTPEDAALATRFIEGDLVLGGSDEDVFED
jgi:hypothetical protein